MNELNQECLRLRRQRDIRIDREPIAEDDLRGEMSGDIDYIDSGDEIGSGMEELVDFEEHMEIGSGLVSLTVDQTDDSRLIQ